jgi:hypothetical protein
MGPASHVKFRENIIKNKYQEPSSPTPILGFRRVSALLVDVFNVPYYIIIAYKVIPIVIVTEYFARQPCSYLTYF